MHIKRYGSLGIGFRRAYLLGRGANPVFYLQNAGQGIVNTNLKLLEREMGKTAGMDVFMGYVKPMSSKVGGELDFYDEMEWRIVASKHHDGCPFEQKDGRFILNFGPTDVELVVFPDASTRKMAISDEDLRGFFKEGYPMMLDAPDVGNL